MAVRLLLLILVSILSIDGRAAGQLEIVSRMVKYGNHCGKGHGNYGRSGGGKVTDAIDRICKKHDKCGIGVRFPSCFCNRKMAKRLEKLNNEFSTGYKGLVRRTYTALFNAMPCYGPRISNGKCTVRFYWRGPGLRKQKIPKKCPRKNRKKRK